MEKDALLTNLLTRTELLRAVELLGPQGQMDARKSKKLAEVAGFCELIIEYVRRHLRGKDPVSIVEFSCGKSYLGVVLVTLLKELEGRQCRLTGVDMNAGLIEKCRLVAERAGLPDARFVASRTLRFTQEEGCDLVVALHACDTATDEAIARGIQMSAPLILAVPCCQNQIRGQIKSGHPLAAMTEFGPIRYRLADMLTDALRAQFLRSAGYHVEMREISSPRLTPKNLCIAARKVKRKLKGGRDEGYRALKALFGVQMKLENFCPGIIGDEQH